MRPALEVADVFAVTAWRSAVPAQRPEHWLFPAEIINRRPCSTPAARPAPPLA